MARSSQRRRYLTSIIVMLVVVAGLWTTVALGCSTRQIPGTNKTECKSPMKPQLGLDLQGGISVVLAPKGAPKLDALEKAVDIIRQRIDALGVAEPDVSRQGNNILIEIPGLKNREAALNIIGKTAELRMRPVLGAIPPSSPQWQTTLPVDCKDPFNQLRPNGRSSSPAPSPETIKGTASPTPSAKATTSGEIRAANTPRPKPSATSTAKPKPKPTPRRQSPAAASPSPSPSPSVDESGSVDVASKPLTLCARSKDSTGADIDPRGWEKLQLGPAALVGTDIAGATGQTAGGGSSLQSVGWEVQLKLTGEGAKKFEQVTGKLACSPDGDAKRQLAIELDGIVESHPQMNSDIKCNTGISGGTAIITGNFTEKEAKDLALVLRFGALPIALVAQETNEISPTLGKDSLKGGLYAGAIGILLTLLYVLLFYRILGLLIWFGLALHAAFTLAVVIILGKTVGFSLSLAGIAGLIVSIGIAADSFIVYFERIKDEVHQGKTIRSSVDRAWSSAWRTIVAADLVTALAAGASTLLSVGSVRGFALMLGLATALDLFISYLVMHPLVWLLSQTKFFNQSKRFGIKRVVGETPALAGGAK